jgi:hypothetical protein
MLGALLVKLQDSDAANPDPVKVTIVSTGAADDAGDEIKIDGAARTVPRNAVSAVTNSAISRISRVTA